MKKFFSFLIILLLTSNIALAQTTRGVATSWTGGDPGLKTVSATSISETSAVFKALYNSLDTNYVPGDAPILYIEYGTTGTLGSTTEGRRQDTGNRFEEFTINGLTVGKLYYYRAVLSYNNKTAYGEVLEYTHKKTTSSVTSTTTLDTTDEVVSSPGVPKDVVLFPKLKNLFKKKETTDISRPGSATKNGIKIDISNQLTNTISGDKPTYTVHYANNSTKVYDEVDIEILLPPEYEFVSTNKGDYYPDVHTVLVHLYTFQPTERGDIQITTFANGKKSNKKSEASAHIYTDSGETIVYDIDQYTAGNNISKLRTARDNNEKPITTKQKRVSSDVSPLAGSTMIGWLIIAAIIGGVVFVSYKYFKKDKY